MEAAVRSAVAAASDQSVRVSFPRRHDAEGFQVAQRISQSTDDLLIVYTDANIIQLVKSQHWFTDSPGKELMGVAVIAGTIADFMWPPPDLDVDVFARWCGRLAVNRGAVSSTCVICDRLLRDDAPRCPICLEGTCGSCLWQYLSGDTAAAREGRCPGCHSVVLRPM
jgi:hypothetical protein